jgi:hypothetical protein
MAIYTLTAAQLYGQGILNSFAIPAASSFDPDAQAFITAAGITNVTQQTAIDNLVIGLKADGTWTKMRAIYPIVGGTATTHKWNLKDPRDLNEAYRLTFIGGLTHSNTGILPNGMNGYADTFFVPSSLADDNIHFSAYYRTTNTRTDRAMGCAYVIGNYEEGTFIAGHSLSPFSTNNGIRYINGGTTFDNVNVTNTVANFIATRTDLVNSKLYRNNVLVSTSSAGFGNAPANMYLMAENLLLTEGGTIIPSYSDKQIAFSTIGEGLDNTQSINLYNRIQAFQTALSRQV